MIRINFKNFKGFNDSKVTDANGKEIISFEKVKALPTRACYSIVNANHEKIGRIEKRRYNFGLVDLPQIIISINNDKIEIQKDMKELKHVIPELSRRHVSRRRRIPARVPSACDPAPR